MMKNNISIYDSYYSFKNYYTGDSNIKAHALAKEIALNKFNNNNKSIVLYATPGNGKNHLAKSIFDLSQETCLYESVHLINCWDILKAPNCLLENKKGLVIIQHTQILANKTQSQNRLKKFIEIFNYQTGNILITTDTPINKILNFSFAHNEILVSKPTHDLKERILREKMQPKYVKDITEYEIQKTCNVNFESIRVFENILFIMDVGKKVSNISYLETLEKLFYDRNIHCH